MREEAVRPQLEEDVEYYTVTDFRAFFLNAVNTLSENPAKRYLITKHGRPEAVLMSFGTYSFMKKIIDRVLAATASPNSSSAIEAAFARLKEESEGKSDAGPDKASDPKAVPVE